MPHSPGTMVPERQLILRKVCLQLKEDKLFRSNSLVSPVITAKELSLLTYKMQIKNQICISDKIPPRLEHMGLPKWLL